MTDRKAWAILTDLLEHRPGYLKIITTIPDPDGAAYPESDPRHWVARPVERLEPFAITRQQGFARAFTKAGDMCDGRPFALLKRLTVYERARAPLVLPPGSAVVQASPATARMLYAA